ncbi:zinc ribbon-containing protein [Dongshaea marina]|uniref:zinc ribbon-containing protein n=1 Tax=Dongshaea marina TaxID=2047966 RepID=UPI002D78D6A7|nr:hypothetical protein [Dongshaea marina]
MALKETLWHWLEEVADHTRIEWSELALIQAERNDEVKAGEWSAAARLKCDKCGEEQLLKHPDVVTACGKCGEQAFHRKEFK